jgi:hypothetical protein
MNLIRGLNRILIVPAAIAMVPSFTAGSGVYRELFRTVVYGKSLELVSYPPDWQCTIAGAVTALISFLLILTGLRSLAGLTQRLIERSRLKTKTNTANPTTK